MTGWRAAARGALLALALAAAACSAPATVQPGPVASAPEAPEASAPPATDAADTRDAAGAPRVDITCRIDADCVVKDVGNCCGYAPACVNRTSRPDPAAVKAECERRGLASTCGFREISACGCDAGRCTARRASIIDPATPAEEATR